MNPDPTLAIIDPSLLLLAYRHGIFPMADARDDPEVFWVEPKLRGILPLDGFHLSHSLARTLRRGRFAVTCNTAFAQVLDACAAPREARNDDGDDGESDDGERRETWISHRIAASYRALHAAGHAHSLECWLPGENGEPRLVGGLYGVGFGAAFCGESMFSLVPDASKVALAWLVAALRLGGARLLDCQFLTGHLASLGAVEIPQKTYLRLLAAALSPHGAPPGQRGAAAASTAGASGAAAGAASALSAASRAPEAFAALAAAAASAGFSSSPGNFIAQSLTQTS